MPKRVICVGIDLAWSYRNATGLAVVHLYPPSGRVDFVDSCVVGSDEEILAWVRQHRGPTTIVGIDAPLIAPNPAGTGRRCDGEVTRVFGRYHAGTYPAHRDKCQRPIQLCREFQRLGFSPDPRDVPRQRGWWQIEVYPHPAQIALFNLSRILKYKKGRVRERRKGLRQLAGYVRRTLSRQIPQLGSRGSLHELCTIPSSLRGRGLKNREDQLDALLCAYIAGHYWFWGERRWRVFGDIRRGYIVCPDIRKWPIKGRAVAV